MDYRLIAQDLLSRKTQLMNARRSLSEEIEMLESEKYSTHNRAISDTTVAVGGGSKYEERLVNLIILTENCKLRKKQAERELKQIENGFAVLDDYETDLLEHFFVYKYKYAAEKIGAKHHRERSSIYEDRKAALEKFARAIYGAVLS